jgi:hypothetical protein
MILKIERSANVTFEQLFDQDDIAATANVQASWRATVGQCSPSRSRDNCASYVAVHGLDLKRIFGTVDSLGQMDRRCLTFLRVFNGHDTKLPNLALPPATQSRVTVFSLSQTSETPSHTTS